MQRNQVHRSGSNAERRRGSGKHPLAWSVLWLAAACLDRPIGTPEPVTTNIFVDKITQTSVNKIDLLFMIDNSGSMSDKQAILRLAVPDLVERLVNPVCIDAAGRQYEPPPPGEICPPGKIREFEPVEDIHIGVISSSLGDLTANTACPAQGSSQGAADGVDMAHLLGSLPRGEGTGAAPGGFLEWRTGVTDPERFSSDFARMIERVGERGCGFEASLEAWYRFLIDPYPYRELARVPCNEEDTRMRCIEPARDASGNLLVDEVLLEQRRAFLRTDSLVAVIMLSDENDCSVQASGTNWIVLDTRAESRMYRGSSACDQDPNAKCCYSCGLRPPEGCSPDRICEIEDRSAGILAQRLPPNQDGVNLRCFDQKRRFGIDLLYPTARYVNALREYELCVSAPDLALEGCPAADRVRNPLFAGGRDRSLVFLGGIVGVPWQSIASSVDQSGEPLLDPSSQLRFKTFDELTNDGTWSEIIGSRGVPWQPASGGRPEQAAVPRTPPSNPYMIESDRPRPGIERGNEINGREYDTTQDGVPAGTPNDLQYACIFPLPEPKTCTRERQTNREACDCYENNLDRPLCEQDPGEAAPGITQHWAKAYPGTRQLEVLRDYGTNSIVASICARNVSTPDQPDFGYRPAISAVVDRLKEQLGSRCLPRALDVAEDGSVPCTLVETKPRPDGECTCDARIARRVPSARVQSLVRGQLASDPDRPCGPDDPSCQGACLCEVLQVQRAATENPEAALQSCREDDAALGVEGWCYVASTPEQQIGNPELVAGCPATQRQLLRFAGTGLDDNTTTFLACVGSSFGTESD